MHLPSSLLLLVVLFNSPILAAPRDLFTRNVSIPNVVITSTIYASFNNTNGTNGAPAFRTLLYLPPKTAALSSLTGRTLAFSEPRLMQHCPTLTATFSHSHCLRHPGQWGGMQRYVVYCRERPALPWDHVHATRLLGVAGMCSADEVCVDSRLGDDVHGVRLARCIDKRAFKPTDLSDDSEDDNSGHIGGEKRRKLVNGFVLGGKQASVVVSKDDEVTPLGAGSMEVSARASGDTSLVQKACHNCFELRTERLALDTDQLSIEATVLTAGTGVAAGVVWVALLSG